MRIADKRINARPILEDDLKPRTLALHPPPPQPTIPQVQDDFYAMNMDNSELINMDQPFGGRPTLNWDFDFALDPTKNSAGELGGMPMDIEAWSSVCCLLICC